MGVLKTKAEDALGRNAPTPGSKSRGTLYNSTGEQTKMKLDNASLTFGGNALAVRKTEIKKDTAGKTVADTYAEHAKLVFLFDVSGSMAAMVTRDRLGSSYSDQFIWLDETMAAIRADATSAAAKLNALDADDDADGTEPQYALTRGEELASALIDQRQFGMPRVFAPADDEDLKQRVMRADMTDQFGILPALGRHQAPLSRMDIVKKLAASEIIARFNKFPDSRVAVVAFGGNTMTLFDDGAADAVAAEVEKLNFQGMRKYDAAGTPVEYMEHNETNILGAVRTGMDICRNKPSAVGLHHFILVTDGGDSDADRSLPGWVPSMKASGVVLDYIHIGDEYANDGVKAACLATGGEFNVCNTEKDIKEKFTLAVARLCLPAPTN